MAKAGEGPFKGHSIWLEMYLKIWTSDQKAESWWYLSVVAMGNMTMNRGVNKAFNTATVWQGICVEQTCDFPVK